MITMELRLLILIDGNQLQKFNLRTNLISAKLFLLAISSYSILLCCFVLDRLEDPDAEEVKDFVQKQVKLTDSVLEKCELRGKFHEKMSKLLDHPRYDAPAKRANKYFYFHNSGLQAQNVLYVQDSLDGEPKVLLDPNTLSEDGTIALSQTGVSEDAKYLAYSLSSSGSDWTTIKVMRIEDKKEEPDTLSWVSLVVAFMFFRFSKRRIDDDLWLMNCITLLLQVKFSGISWTHDSKGFFYSRYPAPK